MKILLVEDTPDMQVLLKAWLKKYGYTVITADNGQQAWDILQDQEDIHLVLSDWMMPFMNGIQLCQTIRQSSRKSYVYFILLTAKGDKNALVKGMEAGADDFISKPANRNELRVRLDAGKRIIKLEQQLEERNHKLQLAYEQISRDLESAASTQKALLPKSGQLGRIQCHWFFYPCHFVAGDMFNYFELDENYLGFYQLDVSGHGVRSALLSFTLHHRIVNNPIQKDLLFQPTNQGYVPTSPENVIAALNQEFQCETEQLIYFTLIYGFINQSSGELHLSQAGHPKPVHLSCNRAYLCGEGGFPVGLLSNMHWDSFCIQLQRGDRFFIYSDGVTECMNPNEQPFSESRLLEFLEETSHQSLPDILEKLGTTLRTWRNNMNFEDDMTMLAFEWL